MQSISVNIAYLPLHPDTAILHLKGFLYANTLVQAEKAVQSVLGAKKKKLVVDLSEADYISSGGWGLLLTVCRSFRDEGGDLVLAGLKPEVNDAFELLEYNKVMKSFPASETALKQGFIHPTAPAKV